MKKVAVLIGAMFLVVCVTGLANASLINQGSGVLFDDVAGQYWVQDLSVFNQMTYDAQITEIGAYTATIGNTVLADWRMADRSDVSSLLATIGGSYSSLSHLVNPGAFLEANRTGSTFTSVWFSGRINEVRSESMHTIWGYKQHCCYPDDIIGVSGDQIEDSVTSATYGAWAVMDQPGQGVDPVPEPATMLLFGLGLLGVAGVSRKKSL